MHAFFNSPLTQQQFLADYWQKKPLLIRQAFSDFKSPISADELAGLACETEIESRLIEARHKAGETWKVTYGPLSADDFAQLAATHWTLLVQDADKHVPELQEIVGAFDFIPDWRRDDLMISYAPEGGSVGAHTDSYDVFLLQAMGTRRWQIMNAPVYEAALVAGIDLQILQEFSADESWQLAPGDMLYLPPHIAHHGVALNAAMTFSIGFRAPKAVELLDVLVNTLVEKGLDTQRYQDADLSIDERGSEISLKNVARVKGLLHQLIDDADAELATTLGKLVSEIKPSLLDLASEHGRELMCADEMAARFAQGQHLLKNNYYRFAWCQHQQGGQFFVAGEVYYVDNAAVVFLAELTARQRLDLADWQVFKQNHSMVALLGQLIAEGAWYWSGRVMLNRSIIFRSRL